MATNPETRPETRAATRAATRPATRPETRAATNAATDAETIPLHPDTGNAGEGGKDPTAVEYTIAVFAALAIALILGMFGFLWRFAAGFLRGIATLLFFSFAIMIVLFALANATINDEMPSQVYRDLGNSMGGLLACSIVLEMFEVDFIKYHSSRR